MRIPLSKHAARRIALSLVPLVLMATGCQNPLNQRNAGRYYEAGLAQSSQGNHRHAVELYLRAVTNADLGKSPADGRAMAYYAYGRELALVGRLEEGEAALLKSLDYQRKVNPPTPMEIMRRCTVLGRLYLDTNRFPEALPYLGETHELMQALEPGLLPPAITSASCATTGRQRKGPAKPTFANASTLKSQD